MTGSGSTLESHYKTKVLRYCAQHCAEWNSVLYWSSLWGQLLMVTICQLVANSNLTQNKSLARGCSVYAKTNLCEISQGFIIMAMTATNKFVTHHVTPQGIRGNGILKSMDYNMSFCKTSLVPHCWYWWSSTVIWWRILWIELVQITCCNQGIKKGQPPFPLYTKHAPEWNMHQQNDSYMHVAYAICLT